jgi:putative membrane protein insertion efficiency factor
LFRQLVLALIDFYRKGVSPLTPPACRFVPTCSAYAREAVDRHGVLRGGWLFLKRFARCHPFGVSGYDPVPPSLRGPKRADGVRHL